MIRKHNLIDCIGMITETHINYRIGNYADKVRYMKPYYLLFVSDPMVWELNHFKIKIK